MADRNARALDDRRLELRLRDVGRLVAYPPTPDLSAGVRQRITAGDGAAVLPPRWRPVRRGLVLALAGLLAIAGAAAAIGLGLPGLSIVFVESPPAGVGQPLDLGERVTLPRAQQQVEHDIMVPLAALGRPDEIYVDERRGVEQVSLVYLGEAVVDVLITQFRATSALTPAVKELGPGTPVEPVTVSGEPGFWIEGAPHLLRYRTPDGATIDDRTRLVGDVLVWQAGELTLRIEGAASQDEALAIARSME